MFGPNTHLTTDVQVRGSHRDRSARAAFALLRREFAEKFNLKEYEICFLLGGGSLGVEALFYSLADQVEVLGEPGTFTSRWSELATIHNANRTATSISGFYCQLETSISAFQYFPGASVDAVSSFPYQPIPMDAPAFVTSSNKLLGSMVGLTIVGVRRDLKSKLLRPEDTSYLSLARYLRYAEVDQTPSTTSTHNIEHLLRRIREFDLAEITNRVNLVSDMIVDSLEPEAIIGAKRSPVITLKKDYVPTRLADQWELYSKPTFGGVYQVFTYSCDVSEYEDFCSQLREAR